MAFDPTYLLFKSVLTLKQNPHFDKLMEVAKDPSKAQLTVLRNIVGTNRETEFGREHSFGTIDSVADYRNAVPVSDFEQLRPYIESQRDEGVQSLTSAAPVCYNRTSGTTGVPKDVPVTAQTLEETRAASQLSAYVLARQSHILRGRVFAIGGSAEEERTKRDTPIGSASGLLYRQQSRFVRSRYVLPPEVFDIENIDSRYVAFAAYGLASNAVTTIATANPSTFVRLDEVINGQIESILRHISDGSMPVSDVALRRPKPNPRRAQQLERILGERGKLNYSQIWPGLAGVITWCGGSCGFALSKLQTLLPVSCKIHEFGYNSSEFRGTINVDLANNACLPTLHHTFFEFVECDDWETGDKRFLGLDELSEDSLYYIFATTSSGLYRYDINDIVRVSGRIHATPTLEFVQKGRGVTNITGEKLTESQVLDAIEVVQHRLNVFPDFFVVLANEADSYYLLCLELETPSELDLIADCFDASLRELNVEFKSKQKSGRLGATRAVALPRGTGFKYRSDLVAAGQRDGQFKYLHLQYLNKTALDLSSVDAF